MTVGDMRAQLQQYDASCPVAIADWGEGRLLPSLGEAEVITREEDKEVMGEGGRRERLKEVVIIGADW